ncbi:MAG: UvrD-helicase domain-containing protein [Pseudomonadota bacterium]
MRSLEGLNPEQKAAVETIDRHLLVVAGAGSGKTRVLTHKIAYLVEEQRVPPHAVLAMTFSNRAAREMLERVRILLPSYEQPRWIGTFHSICLRFLKEFSREAGLPPYFTIYDESDQISALKRATRELNLDPKRFPPSTIQYYIDRAKNETGDVLKWLTTKQVLTEGALKIAEAYERLLRQNHALDFGDLLTQAVRILRDVPAVRDELRRRFKRILIDEYQDTNRIQKELVRELAGAGAVVCAVGDEDQSIYGWRGARVENILEFDSDFPGAHIVKLEQNYRSTQRILDAANHVIGHNVGRRGKNLWTKNEEGALVTFRQTEDDHEEAAYVFDRIEEMLREKAHPAREIAIFYRTHAQSRILEEESRRRNLPYRIFGGVRFYDRAEIKDMMAFLRLLLNPADDLSFLRVVNLPSRGIGGKTLESLGILAREKGCSLLASIPHVQGQTKAERALRDFHEWFAPLLKEASTRIPADAAEEILERSGYRKALQEADTIEAESRLENIDELLRSMEEFAEEDEGALPAYLDRVSLIADVDSFDPQGDVLTLMTTHNSKGLEFNAVFVVGMEEGIFPHQRSLDDGDPNEIEEERRLCYVAMTRARKALTLTAAARRRLYQSTQYNPVSRFIGEIPAKFLKDETGSGQDASRVQVSRYSYWGKARTPRKSPQTDEYRQESYDEDDLPRRAVWGKAAVKAQMNAPFPPGAQVLHPDFGLGTVRRCEGKDDNLKLTVQFQSVGLKKLMLKYCTLELVSR